MRTTFLHCADIHLGDAQYHSDERYDDFARAFAHIVDEAIARRVACVAIAGDLFHRRAIDAQTLYIAQEHLGRLRAAGIRAVTVEGNHDRAYYRDNGVSWLTYLSWTGAVAVLAPELTDDSATFTLWSPGTGGGYVDVPGDEAGRVLRVYGVPWYGASTPAVIKRVAEGLRAVQSQEDAAGVAFRVLMLHTGIAGIVPGTHGMPTPEQFDPLRGLIDYVALGHVHKPFTLSNDWLMNPGSIETVSAEEWDWPERGYFFVTIDSSQTPPFRAEQVVTPKRRFVRWVFRVEGYADPDALYQHFDSSCARHLSSRDDQHGPFTDGDPVIDVALRGTLAFDPGALDRRHLESIVRRHSPALLVLVRMETDAFDAAPDGADLRDRATRQQVELLTLRDLVQRDSRFAPHADEWARTLAALKQHALEGDPPEIVAEWLRDERLRIQGN
jgi:exonuclease SbcD